MNRDIAKLSDFHLIGKYELLQWISAIALVLVLSSSQVEVFAQGSPDYEREARLAEETEAGLFDGDAVYLSAESRDFLAVYTKLDDFDAGAVILLHGTWISPGLAAGHRTFERRVERKRNDNSIASNARFGKRCKVLRISRNNSRVISHELMPGLNFWNQKATHGLALLHTAARCICQWPGSRSLVITGLMLT